MTKIQFIGATEDVTGSMTLIENADGRILIDCGLYQGTALVAKKNLEKLPFDPKSIKAIILTHAHLDHSGMIPRLIRKGFRGAIYSTTPTMKLARLIMADCARIMEDPLHPLHMFYEMEDVVIAPSLFKQIEFLKSFTLLGMKITLRPAGHILGAASVLIEGEKTMVFSGDLGRSNDPLMPKPLNCPPADFLVMESTYGSSVRQGDIQSELTAFLKKIKRESKVGIIASFAVARSQLLITLITEYFNLHPDEKIRFVIDGPMMTEANKVYSEFTSQTLMPAELKKALEEVEVIEHTRDWLSLQKKSGPLVVVTSSGMVSGGRIWRYLENWQHDPNACLFLPGFQAIGTAGRALAEGVRQVHDEEGKIINWSGEVITTSAFSSHADQSELIEWINDVGFDTAIHLNHGEQIAKLALKEKLQSLGYKNITVVKHLMDESVV